nr:alcohol dehydrogenase catalytic domain-containing protein [Actinomycetota bacterium]
MRIRAAVLHRPGTPVVVEEVELTPPRQREVLVRVVAAGVCHSDVRLADGALGAGRFPIVLGHEGAGVVEAVGEGVTHVRPGDHVAFCFVPACGACRPCRVGRLNLCEPVGARSVAGTLLDGSSRLGLSDGTVLQHGLLTACFAEYVVVDAAALVPLPPELPLWQAALLGCGVVTGIGAVRNTAGVKGGETVCVIGCGGVGQHVVAGARLAGAARI